MMVMLQESERQFTNFSFPGFGLQNSLLARISKTKTKTKTKFKKKKQKKLAFRNYIIMTQHLVSSIDYHHKNYCQNSLEC